MINNSTDFNSPLRKIKGKAELYNSSAIAASGTIITASNVCPKTHDVKVSVARKNLLDANTLFGQQAVTELVIGNNSFTGRGGVGDKQYAWNAGQIMFPYINATNITNTGFELKTGTTYTVSFNASIQEVGTYGNTIQVLVYRLNDAGTNTSVEYNLYGLVITLDTNNRYSFSFSPSKDTKYGLCFRISNNLMTISNIQIEEATDDTPFTPYIADTSTIGVKRYGKNLFNPSHFPKYDKLGLTIEYLKDEDCFLLNGTFTGSTSDAYKLTFDNYILGNIGEYYTVSAICVGGSINIPSGYARPYFGVAESLTDTSSTNWLDSINMNDTIATRNRTLTQQYISHFWFVISNGVIFDNYKVKIQLEKGSTATDYEPFKEPVDVVNGTVKSLSPAFNLIPNEPGLMLSAEFNGIQKIAEYSYQDALKEIVIDRTGENGKFFGFGVCQKLTVNLLDKERSITTSPASAFIPYLGFGEGEYTRSTFPMFYVDETKRDENTGELSVTAYDTVKLMEQHEVSNLGLSSYTIMSLLQAIAGYFCLTLEIVGVDNFTSFNTDYPEGANLEGTESMREVLNRIAEVTQTIYYIDNSKLIFKRISAETALTIPKAGYITLTSKDSRRLSAICSATELGENYISADTTGVTQYVRDNPFWELREDITELVDNAAAEVNGLTITEFNCSWRGNYYLEIGDCIEIVGKNDQLIKSYVFNDKIKYNGGMSQETQWAYEESENETAANPTNLGDAIHQTFAKVDKVNKQIQIVVNDTENSKTTISQLQLEVGNINASVSESKEAVDELNDEVINLTNSVKAQMTPEQIKLEIANMVENGVDTVITGKGFSFNNDGLVIEDINPNTNQKIKTTISNNGMIVSVEDEEVLTANDWGVYAADLHAHTFLIVGSNSRFEDYDNGSRTGCFWVG